MWQRSGGSRNRWLDQGGAQVSKDLRSRCSAQKNLTISVRDMYFIPSICALVVPRCSPACIGKGSRLRFKRSSQHKHLSSYKKETSQKMIGTFGTSSVHVSSCPLSDALMAGFRSRFSGSLATASNSQAFHRPCFAPSGLPVT